MHILVTGSYGQLGQSLKHLLETGSSEVGELSSEFRVADVDYVDMKDMDISQLASVRAYFDAHDPYDVVINCAAMTNVDGCDHDRKAAFAANAQGPYHLALMCEQQQAKLVHVSTDYVFAGNDPSPRSETDIPYPISGYGQSKFAGEALVQAHCSRAFIVRTAWLYGYVGKNFVKTMLTLADTHDEIEVVSDQMGNPTSAEDVAYAITQILSKGQAGIYHATCEGTCSWYDFACTIMKKFGKACVVHPISSKEYKQKNPQSAARPLYSALAKTALADECGYTMRTWQEALSSYAHNFDRYAHNRTEY